jgi:peptide/nickel transport system permease protein
MTRAPLFKSMQKMMTAIRGIPIFPTLVLSVFILSGIFSGFLAPYDPVENHINEALSPPVWQQGGTTKYLLGTDHLGRDMLSRLLYGATVSLRVGFIVVFVSGGTGAILAILAGFIGGWVGTTIMRLTDMMLSIPYLLIAIVMAVLMGPSVNNVIIILIVLGWTQYTRVLHSEVLRVKEADFIQLAKVAGCSKTRMMLRHVFPNIVNTLIILGTLNLGQVIIMEASLSFIGAGVPPVFPAWGRMLADGRQYITYAWWLCVWPGLAILLVVLSCNLLGDWIRVRLDPKFRQI